MAIWVRNQQEKGKTISIDTRFLRRAGARTLASGHEDELFELLPQLSQLLGRHSELVQARIGEVQDVPYEDVLKEIETAEKILMVVKEGTAYVNRLAK